MTRKHTLALAVAGVLAAAGTGAALAASSGGSHPAAGSAGRAASFVPAGPGSRGGWGFPGGRGFFGARGLGVGFGASGVLQAAAKYLDVPVSTLLGDLRSGKSLADVAGEKGKSESDLVGALVADAKSQLDKAVSAGRLSQDQASKLEANLQQRITSLVEAKRPAPSTVPAVPKPGFGRGFGWLGAGGLIQAAAKYLDVPVSTLLGDLRSGKSLADVAGEKGKSESDLVGALVADAKSQLDKAVSAGRLSQDQASKLEANLQQRITSLVELKWSAAPFRRGRGFGHGFGFGGGRHGGWAAPQAGHANA